MAKLAFFSFVYNNKRATEHSLQSIRQYHPDAYYMLIGDGGVDHTDLAKKYNCDFLYCNDNLGYPESTYGYRKEGVLEWLKRFYIACVKCNSTHILIAEDDIVLIDRVTVEDHWELAAHDIKVGNQIPQQLIDFCEEFSGVKPKTNFYGSGGGAIFNVHTVLEHFGKIYHFFENNLDNIQNNLYPTMGWLDCFTTYFFYLAGKDYTGNPNLYNIYPPSRDFDLETLKGKYQIIHGYKNYYD
ncbi:MAG: hypothetical protein WCG15_00990 [Actinomycetes bacterium]|jgi:hypothetical protein